MPTTRPTRPRSKESELKEGYLRVLALAAVAALTLGACGGDGGGDNEGEEAQTVGVDDYASDVCAALSTWVTDIQDRAATITEGIDPGDEIGRAHV